MRTKIVLTFISLCILSFKMPDDSFKQEQLKYQRVRTAYRENEDGIKNLLNGKGINSLNIDIFIRVFKKEECIEVWTKEKTKQKYGLLKKYDICNSSGSLGPKRRQGDLQIPEGLYFIDRFNPYSNFYLSLGINYPNQSDRILGYKANLGGDIFIHGNCVTIGCIPITDDKIKELYVLTVEAKSSGQSKIPVHIFPCSLNDSSFNQLKDEYSDKPALIDFWSNLKTGYDHFELKKEIPSISVNSNGEYVFN